MDVISQLKVNDIVNSIRIENAKAKSHRLLEDIVNQQAFRLGKSTYDQGDWFVAISQFDVAKSQAW